MAIAARDKRGPPAQRVKKGRKENPLFFTWMFHLLCPRCAIKVLMSGHNKLGHLALAQDRRVGLRHTYKQRSPPSSICMDIFTVPVPAQQQYDSFLSACNLKCRRKQVVLLLNRYRVCKNVHTNGRRRGSLVAV